MSYSAFTYPTLNIGDFIQTLAAMQFLPRVDYFINRENMQLFSLKQDTFLIANGWYMHNMASFPPPENIKPFYISIHICTPDMLTEKAVEHFKKHEPIGCRDHHTLELLRGKGIIAYLSGDITITLRNKFKKRTDNIYMVGFDYDKSLLEIIPKDIRKKALYLSNRLEPNLLDRADRPIPEEITQFKLKKAQELLDLYAQAKLVITSKLHCTLPCLALGTPVVAVYYSPDDIRFDAVKKHLPVNSPAKKEIDWNPRPVDCSFDANILSELCKKAVEIRDNPLKDYRNLFISNKDKILSLFDINKFLGLKR